MEKFCAQIHIQHVKNFSKNKIMFLWQKLCWPVNSIKCMHIRINWFKCNLIKCIFMKLKIILFIQTATNYFKLLLNLQCMQLCMYECNYVSSGGILQINFYIKHLKLLRIVMIAWLLQNNYLLFSAMKAYTSKVFLFKLFNAYLSHQGDK